jgi:hypothetical protein
MIATPIVCRLLEEEETRQRSNQPASRTEELQAAFPFELAAKTTRRA